MLNFFISGVLLIAWGLWRFKQRILYPSVVFAAMWGFCCIYMGIILAGAGENLFLKEYYSFMYIDKYILPFTLASIIGFSIPHFSHKRTSIHNTITEGGVDGLLKKIEFIIWLNFIGGILRMIVMIAFVGFSFDAAIDYRVAANNVMMGHGSGLAYWIFKLTAYVQLFANLYIFLAGFKEGLGSLNQKRMIGLFILYSTPQLATGGRLFVLYFIIFYFGAFLLARGLSRMSTGRRWLAHNERNTILLMGFVMFAIIVFIANLRSGSASSAINNSGSSVEKLAYVTEGTLLAEYCMQELPPDVLQIDYGQNLFGVNTKNHRIFQESLLPTKLWSSVESIIVPLYLDWGYWGSLIAWLLIAFIIEMLSIHCLSRLTVMKLFVYSLLLKICYESVMSTSVAINMPVAELLILIAVFFPNMLRKRQ